MDPLSIVGASVAITEAIFSTYKTVKKITGLPKAFDEVGNNIPFMQNILGHARTHFSNGEHATDEEAKTIEAVFTSCHDKLVKLKQIFDQVATASKKEGDPKWAKIRVVYGKALRGIKAHRVETLMGDIMKGVKQLALSQLFKTAMREDLAGIEEAIRKLSEVPASLPDDEFETAETIHATQTIATGGWGQQNNTQGGVNTFNSGKYMATGEGQRIYYVNNLNMTEPGAPKAYCVIPLPRNEDVVDRANIFAQLNTLLPPKPAHQSAALYGLGGSGKTQVALAYGYGRCSDPACSVFWVRADNETTFTQDYKTIARALGLADNLEGEELLAAVRERIEAEPRWVAVYDNADDLALFGVGRMSRSTWGGQARESTGKSASLYDYVPRGATGTVLWTSRDERIVGTLVGARRGIQVGRMSGDEAMALLETSRNEKVGGEEVGDARKLLEELQWLALAISQAGAYLRRTSALIKEYLSRLAEEKERWQVLQATEFDRYRQPNVPNSILETWSISIERIRQGDEMAYKILHIIAYVNNQNIPFEIVAAAGMFGDKLQKGESWEDKDRVVEAATRLKEFSFLGLRRGEGGLQTYEMHKLVLEAARYRLSVTTSEGRVYFSNAALQIMAKLFPERKRETWAECEKYIAHAVQVGEWAEICEKEAEASDLLTQVSHYLFDRGRWREKEPVDKRAYELRKRVLGDKHPDTIRSMALLAVTYHVQGRYDEAEKIKVEVLGLRREVLGDKHPDTIRSMAELAATYHAQGRYDEAEKIKVEVLGLRREVLGDKHPDTMWSMAELAVTYHAQGRYDKAEKIKVEVLGLQREVLGDKHPDSLQAMHDLAITWSSRGRRDDALALMDECLQLRRSVLGPNHPFTEASDQTLKRWKTKKVPETRRA